MMHVYRFRDLVAISPPGGSTFYLLPVEAAKLGAAMMEVSSDCLTYKFTESTIGTVAISIEANGSRYRGPS
jgi:hypothetical protein